MFLYVIFVLLVLVIFTFYIDISIFIWETLIETIFVRSDTNFKWFNSAFGICLYFRSIEQNKKYVAFD